MTLTRTHIDLLAVAALLIALVGSFLEAHAAWPTGLALWAVLLAMFLRDRVAAGPRDVRTAPVWIAPAILCAMAVQMVAFAAPEERPQTLALAGGFVAVAIGVWWLRRRAA